MLAIFITPLRKDDELQFVSYSISCSLAPTAVLPKHGPKEVIRVADARRMVQEEAQEILQDLKLTGMVTCLLNGINVASGISSVATLSTLIGPPVSIPLETISLAGASISSVATLLAKKYQKKLAKIMKLADIITSALPVFERSVSKVLNDGRVDEQEFGMLQISHLEVLSKLTNIHHKKEAKTRTQLQKVYWMGSTS